MAVPAFYVKRRPDPQSTSRTAQARVDAWAGVHNRRSTAPWAGRHLWGRYAPGPVMGLITFAFLSWGLGRPAFWLDEGASVVATQRSWTDLFRLLQGADAPLVPYYAVLKTTTGFLRALSPA